MELRTNIIGYHVNDKDRCDKFIEDEKYIICSNDTCWLGYGMYFWDNNANKNQPLGIKLDKMFDYYEVIDENFKAIRVFGKYENSIEMDFLIYQTQKDKVNNMVTNKIKTVYCVRCYEYVCNRELQGVEKNEFYRGN